MTENRTSWLKAVALGSSIATTLAVLVGGGFLLGRYLDKSFNTQPLFQISIMLLGLILGGVNLVITLKKLGTSKDEK